MNPLLLDFPHEFETERLRIARPKIGDGAIVNAAILESLAELRPWMPWAQVAPSVDDSEAVIRQCNAHWLERSDLTLHIWEKSSGQFVGGSGLHRINWDVPKFEIGYWLRTSVCGCGLMTEAVRGIADFAFRELDARRVEIRCDAQNERSRRVAERAEFALEGILRNHEKSISGELRDTCIFARLPLL